MLIESGTILKGERAWAWMPKRLRDLRVPPTSHWVCCKPASIRLTNTEKIVMHRASVVGPGFYWDDAVAHLWGI